MTQEPLQYYATRVRIFKGSVIGSTGRRFGGVPWKNELSGIQIGFRNDKGPGSRIASLASRKPLVFGARPSVRDDDAGTTVKADAPM